MSEYTCCRHIGPLSAAEQHRRHAIASRCGAVFLYVEDPPRPAVSQFAFEADNANAAQTIATLIERELRTVVAEDEMIGAATNIETEPGEQRVGEYLGVIDLPHPADDHPVQLEVWVNPEGWIFAIQSAFVMDHDGCNDPHTQPSTWLDLPSELMQQNPLPDTDPVLRPGRREPRSTGRALRRIHIRQRTDDDDAGRVD